MATTDEQGNKLPQPRIKKTVKSANERAQTKHLSTRCCGCGFRARGPEHSNGAHHRQWWNSLSKVQQEQKKSLAPLGDTQ